MATTVTKDDIKRMAKERRRNVNYPGYGTTILSALGAAWLAASQAPEIALYTALFATAVGVTTGIYHFVGKRKENALAATIPVASSTTSP